MSDFDAQDVLRKVDAGLTPTNWTSMRARKGYFYEQGFTYAVIALMVAGIGVVIGFITALPQNNSLPNTPSSQSDVWLFAGITIFALLVACVLAWAALYQFSQLRTVGTHVFVLTPNGCVARTGPKPYQTYGVAYAQVAAIAMSVEHARYETAISLILTYISDSNRRQRREQWRINPQFKASDAIAQAIIEAHTRYAVTRAPASAREAPH